MNIDNPGAGQVPALKALWKTAFGDTDAFLSPFFDIAYSPDRCRCVLEDGKVAAALYWFECFCGDDRLAYIYAVATDPEYRNCGLCRVLMEDTAVVLKDRGYDGMILYPASESLSRMYGKMGFEHWTTVTELSAEAGDEPVPLRKIGRDEYAALRRKLLPPGGVVQEGPLLDFLATQAEFYAGEGWVAAVSPEEEQLHCHELLGDTGAAPGIVQAFGKKAGFFRTFGGKKPFAMGRALAENCKSAVYFGLPLD